MKEIWKDVVGYNGKYQVSNHGKVRSISRKFNYIPTILKLTANNSGYLCLGLTKNSKYKTHTAHRLVAAAFLGVPEAGVVTNHKDGNKHNNNIENLEYISERENRNHSYINRKTKYLTGVQKQPHQRSYQAHAYKNGKHIYLGCRPTEIEAHHLYLSHINGEHKYADK